MREMKDSGVEWIGEIPVEWKCSKIKHHFKIGSGTTPKSDIPSYWDGDIVWITPADFKTDDVYVSEGHRNLTQEGFESSTLEIIPAGNIIFSKRAPIGQVVINSVDLCTNQGCLTAVPLDKSNVKYYRYAMSVATNQFELAGSGTTFNEISATAFGDFILPSPNVSDQNKITEYLDRKCSSIDSVIMKQQVIVEKLKEYKISFVTEAVTKGLNKNVPLIDSGTAWMGIVPVGWKKYRIANLYDQTAISGREDLPILTVSINSGISDSELDEAEQERQFVRSEDRTKYKRVRPGDLVYNMMRAWQGAFGAARVDGMVSPAYVTCRPKNNVQIDSRFIEYLFRTPIAIEEMHRYSHGVADFRLRLYWNEFRNIQVCLPDINEQRIIADYIDVMMKKIEYHIRERESIIAKLKLYRSSLIYEIVTGKKAVD